MQVLKLHTVGRTLIFMAMTQNHGDSRKSRHTTKITVKATVIVDSERIQADCIHRIDQMLILNVANRSMTSRTQMRNPYKYVI